MDEHTRLIDRPGRDAPTQQLLADRYELVRIAGQGGSGSVWLARDTRLDRDVAIKLLHAHETHDRTFVRGLLDEARKVARLSHPNIVAVYDADVADGRPYIAMEYVTGRSLYEHIATAGRLSIDDTVALAVDILDALDHANRRGILHRDIKSANVMVSFDLSVRKLTDFGNAKDRRDGPASTSLVGTAPYMAPERLRGEAATPASDLYSLACVLYECLAGTPPYGREGSIDVAMRHLNVPVPHVSSVRPDCGAAFDDVLVRALAKDPRDRFADARTMAAALREAATGRGDAIASTRRLARRPWPRADRTMRIAVPRRWTRRVPWTEGIVAVAFASAGFKIASRWEIGGSVPRLLPLFAALVTCSLAFHRVARRGRAANVIARCDGAVASAVERTITFGRWTRPHLVRALQAVRRFVSANVRRAWTHAREAGVMRKAKRRIRRYRRWRRLTAPIRHARRHSVPLGASGWIAGVLSTVVLVSFVIGGLKGWTNDPQIPRSPAQAAGLVGAASARALNGVIGVPLRLVRHDVAAPATELRTFDANALSSADTDRRHPVEYAARCSSSRTVGSAYRCVMWQATGAKIVIEDPCFAAGAHAVVCVYGNDRAGRFSRFDLTQTVAQRTVRKSTSGNPWRLELANGLICNVARWATADRSVLPLIVPESQNAREPSSWVCTQSWDRRPFVQPDYGDVDPQTAGYFSFRSYKVDDAGHYVALRLDRTSSAVWQVLLRHGSGFRAVDVVRAWF